MSVFLLMVSVLFLLEEQGGEREREKGVYLHELFISILETRPKNHLFLLITF